ncbi:MAG: hypothetical protein AAFS11_07010, partial [Planctomycetota bacterium]
MPPFAVSRVHRCGNLLVGITRGKHAMVDGRPEQSRDAVGYIFAHGLRRDEEHILTLAFETHQTVTPREEDRDA